MVNAMIDDTGCPKKNGPLACCYSGANGLFFLGHPVDVLRHTDTQSYEYTHIILELLLHLKKIEKKNNISKFYCGLLNDYKTRFMTKLSWMFAISLSHCLVIIFG